jgi:hypothetical protein
VSFSGVDLGGNEGRLGTEGPINGLTVTRSFFGNNGYGDGIQLGGGTNITIGPGNTFDGINQAYCDSHGGAHCDSIQSFIAGSGLLIKGNWFKNGETYLMFPDGGVPMIIENNVFDNSSNTYDASIQMGSITGLIFRHNTIYSTDLHLGSKVGMSASTNALVENNIFNSNVLSIDGSGCTGCTYRFNQFNTSGNGSGTNQIIGTPAYVGGSPPQLTWAGWQLAAGSPGKNAGNDGKDVGTNYYGTGTITPPSSACDLNNDSLTTVTDVQLEVNHAIGVLPYSLAADINQDGQCNVIDVQRVVNAALGGQCVTQ